MLLLLDGHASHTKNLEAITFTRENNLVMLCFPPHCTHRLQLLDVGFMAPLSAYYGQEIKIWLRSNPGRVVTHFQIARLLGTADAKAATLEMAINSFAKTGILPLNENVFTDVDFAASDVTERENENVGEDQAENENASENQAENYVEIEELILKDQQTPPPGTSKSVFLETTTEKETMIDDALPSCSNASFTVPPADVCPREHVKRLNAGEGNLSF